MAFATPSGEAMLYRELSEISIAFANAFKVFVAEYANPGWSVSGMFSSMDYHGCRERQTMFLDKWISVLERKTRVSGIGSDVPSGMPITFAPPHFGRGEETKKVKHQTAVLCTFVAALASIGAYHAVEAGLTLDKQPGVLSDDAGTFGPAFAKAIAPFTDERLRAINPLVMDTLKATYDDVLSQLREAYAKVPHTTIDEVKAIALDPIIQQFIDKFIGPDGNYLVYFKPVSATAPAIEPATAPAQMVLAQSWLDVAGLAAAARSDPDASKK